MAQYWNHNAAYHPWLLRLARQPGGGVPEVLDVGCGEGLLLARLADAGAAVLGIDPDPSAVARARRRGVSADVGDLLSHDFGARRFDLVVFVASLHHMDAAAALARARTLLRPGGTLAVVGLTRTSSPLDWLVSGLMLPVVRVASRVHGERRDIGVRVADPAQTLRQLRRTARQVLPGARLRRGLYYRCLLTWRAPGTPGGADGARDVGGRPYDRGHGLAARPRRHPPAGPDGRGPI